MCVCGKEPVNGVYLLSNFVERLSFRQERRNFRVGAPKKVVNNRSLYNLKKKERVLSYNLFIQR